MAAYGKVSTIITHQHTLINSLLFDGLRLGKRGRSTLFSSLVFQMGLQALLKAVMEVHRVLEFLDWLLSDTDPCNAECANEPVVTQ